VDALDSEGYTPLCTAAAAGRVTCAWRLLRSGCNPALTTATGRTALHLAAVAGCAAVVRLLARWDADRGVLQGVRDETGKTPLDLARSDEVSNRTYLRKCMCTVYMPAGARSHRLYQYSCHKQSDHTTAGAIAVAVAVASAVGSSNRETSELQYSKAGQVLVCVDVLRS
jgi:Ankyrin repeats (many copies)